MRIREHCFTGEWKRLPLHVVNGEVSGRPTVTYKEAHMHRIKDDKMANMVTMYNCFISPKRFPEYLPLLQQTLATSVTLPSH